MYGAKAIVARIWNGSKTRGRTNFGLPLFYCLQIQGNSPIYDASSFGRIVIIGLARMAQPGAY